MTQEFGKKRGVLVLQSDPAYGGPRQAYTDDDEAWRTFLENPLTAASKAMMSINGDEDSANALGLLYDYYKVPREKRAGMQTKVDMLGANADPDKINLMVPLQESLSAMTTLRTVPLHMVAQESPPKRGLFLPAPASLSSPPSYATPPEGALHTFSHGPHSDGMVFSRHLNHSQFSPRTQSLTPDSTYPESSEVYPLNEDHLRITSISPEAYSSFNTGTSQQFEYTLEAPQSLRSKNSSGQMSYLNKSQFYPISLKELSGGKGQPHSSRVRSVVMLVFGEEKATEDQLKHWKYWHSRQHTAKQRCIDIADYKESFNSIANIDEIAYNAISFTWDPKDEVQILVSVNCLSTDFSSQKGVRGLPLNLQIDTYSCSGPGDKLIHRAYCQIKVFCDKGAERKIRDEERKQSQRKGKGQDAAALRSVPCAKDPVQQKHVDITVFKSMSDMDSRPVLFTPEVQFPCIRQACPSDDNEDSLGQKRLLYPTEEDFGSGSNKRSRVEETEKVLLYIRKEADEVFDALMLKTPTLAGLLEAVSSKYELPIETMGKVYKRCKKGILINMDDNIIKHYSNEDAFQIYMEEYDGRVSLTLTEI